MYQAKQDMMRILAIGNSFSQDSTTYLYDLAKSDGVELKVVNLYIGGCSLEHHWNNIAWDKADYMYQLNGVETDRYVGIKEALLEEKWDIITLQQASHYSGLLDTYYPYIKDIYHYVKQYGPKAKVLIHQTWAYEIDSDHSEYVNYHNDQTKMYQELKKCYDEVAKELSLEQIPFGDVVQQLRTIPEFDYAKGGKSLCRDGFHMHLVYGRYALAATWYQYVLKGNILNNNYRPPVMDQVSATDQELMLIKRCIYDMYHNNFS